MPTEPSSWELPPTTAVADVLQLKGGSGWLSPPLRRMAGRDLPVLAPAATVSLAAERGGGGLGQLFSLLDDGLFAGRALVLAGAASLEGAVWGEILTCAAEAAAVAAVLVDGYVRDLPALPAECPPLWGRDVRTVGPGRDVRIAALDTAVTVGAVRVEPHDTVLVDGVGAVSIAASNVGVVFDDAVAYATAELDVIDALRAGHSATAAYARKRTVVDRLLARGPGDGRG